MTPKRTGLEGGQAHLGPLVVGVDVTEHGQDKRSRLTRAGLGLGNQVLRSGTQQETMSRQGGEREGRRERERGRAGEEKNR